MYDKELYAHKSFVIWMAEHIAFGLRAMGYESVRYEMMVQKDVEYNDAHKYHSTICGSPFTS